MNLLLKLLMKVAGGLAPSYVDKVDVKLMNEWLKGLAGDNTGYKHYYTFRKRQIQEGMVSGLTQEQYWINHGRILELQYINALIIKLLREAKRK